MFEDFTDRTACSQIMATPSLSVYFMWGWAKLTLYTIGSARRA